MISSHDNNHLRNTLDIVKHYLGLTNERIRSNKVTRNGKTERERGEK